MNDRMSLNGDIELFIISYVCQCFVMVRLFDFCLCGGNVKVDINQIILYLVFLGTYIYQVHMTHTYITIYFT